MVKKPKAVKEAAREEAKAAEEAEDAKAPAAEGGEEPAQPKKRKHKVRTGKMRRDSKKKRVAEKKEQETKERDENNAAEDAEHLDKRLVVANLPTSTTRQELRELFERFGTVHRARLFVNSKGVFRGVGFVTFENEAEFQEALKVSGMEFNKQTLRVEKADPPPKKKEVSVFVGGLPFTAEEAKIRKHFKSCGDIKDVRMQEDRVRKKFNGIAFIQFKTEEAAKAALKLDRSAFGGRSLLVKMANPKKKPLPKKEKGDSGSAGQENKKKGKKEQKKTNDGSNKSKATVDDSTAKRKASDAADDVPAKKKAKKAADVTEAAPEAAPEKKKKKKQKSADA